MRVVATGSGRRDRVQKASQPYNSNGGKKVYVGNLSYEVAWQDLKDHFKSAGRVVHADVLQEAGGRSKGCGIVEFASARDARNAIETLNDTELRGRQIFVREDREDRPANNNSSNRSVGSASNSNSTIPGGIVVENLPSGYDWRDLKDSFKPYGAVLRADIITETENGCIGVVDFKSIQDAKKAKNALDGATVNDRQVSVRLRGSEKKDKDEDDNDKPRFKNRLDGEALGERKLYVGQLAWSVTWQSLKDHFKQSGKVIRADVATENSGRSRGFGFVEFETPEEAERAIQELNNSTLDGRKIYVRLDREQN